MLAPTCLILTSNLFPTRRARRQHQLEQYKAPERVFPDRRIDTFVTNGAGRTCYSLRLRQPMAQAAVSSATKAPTA